MSRFYMLDGRRAVPCDLYTWAALMRDDKRRRVADTQIGDARISTVFVGLDHSFGKGPPQLFETMVFGGPLDEQMGRCATWEQAETMHEAMCARVRDEITT